MPTVETLLAPFFTWKKASGKRRFEEKSKTKYEQYLLPFAAWAGDRDISALTTQLLEFEFLPLWTAAFAERNEREPAENTIRLLHNSLASFYDYCWRRGLVPVNPMAAIPRPSYEAPMNDWLSTDEDMAIADVRKTPLEDIVIGILRLAGLRVDEAGAVLAGQADRDQQLLHIFGTKTAAAVRSVVIFPELDAKLERWLWLQQRAGLTDVRLPLITTRAGGRLAAPYIWRIVKRVSARAGVRLHGRDAKGRPVAIDDTGENVSEVMPRTLRRTFGSDLLNRGCRIEVVSKQMGHANTRITEQAYAKLLSTTQREEVLRLGSGYPFFVKDRLPRRR
jgi:integrase/recombinase XerD